jgi:hypothetical protein
MGFILSVLFVLLLYVVAFPFVLLETELSCRKHIRQHANERLKELEKGERTALALMQLVDKPTSINWIEIRPEAYEDGSIVISEDKRSITLGNETYTFVGDLNTIHTFVDRKKGE